jgi:uncharacterized protein (DUF305 family)
MTCVLTEAATQSRSECWAVIRVAERVRSLLLSAALAASCVSAAGDAGTGAGRGPQATDEATYLEQNDAAMAKMMTAMAVQPTGDVDHDFVAMMVPHHQGAIDMATAVLRYGTNEKIRRLAQEIIVTQQEEIAAMQLAVGEPLPPSAPSPTQTESVAMPTDANRY